MNLRWGLVFLITDALACGGATETTTTTTTPTATASASTIASAGPADSASPDDNSPASIGTRHKKFGNGWFLSGSGHEFYDAIYEPGAEPVVLVKPTADAHGRWMTLMKNVSAAPYIGKKIRIRIGVKSVAITGRGEVWARPHAPHDPPDAPNTSTKLDATSEMKMYELVIDVKDGTRVVEYGVGLAGEGQFYVGKDAIDVVP